MRLLFPLLILILAPVAFGASFEGCIAGGGLEIPPSYVSVGNTPHILSIEPIPGTCPPGEQHVLITLTEATLEERTAQRVQAGLQPTSSPDASQPTQNPGAFLPAEMPSLHPEPSSSITLPPQNTTSSDFPVEETPPEEPAPLMLWLLPILVAAVLLAAFLYGNGRMQERLNGRKAKHVRQDPVTFPLNGTVRDLLVGLLARHEVAAIIMSEKHPVGMVAISDLAVVQDDARVSSIPMRPLNPISPGTRLDQLSERDEPIIAVVHRSKLLGVISQEQVLEGLERKGMKGRIDTIAVPAISIDQDASIADALPLMQKHETLIVTQEDQAVGIVGQAELLEARYNYASNSDKTAVSFIMRKVVPLDEQDPWHAASARMRDYACSALPVNTEKGLRMVTRQELKLALVGKRKKKE